MGQILEEAREEDSSTHTLDTPIPTPRLNHEAEGDEGEAEEIVYDEAEGADAASKDEADYEDAEGVRQGEDEDDKEGEKEEIVKKNLKLSDLLK